MSTGLTPDFRPNQYRTALGDAAAHATTTAATLTDEGGHPLHRALEDLALAWRSRSTVRADFESEVLDLSRTAAAALGDHVDALRAAVGNEPPVVDPAGPQGWKSRYATR
ncbi:hypothetical protein J1G42_14385 [Cellulomonas sp. zg-ZUI222]|uniref:hypothetical protein n=1 Tax=Cellulomonas TaxID=1707 RepID=UPI001A94A0B0|nr:MULTISPECIES: hypothetical protein [Cellulomonas]MBO0901772.1 hypothetical protein [Cellulomonas sp. zg-ZUI22]MBO0922009.1 hypothetical protein [Cellulomonas wangleii]